jgi:hypothetical protein
MGFGLVTGYIVHLYTQHVITSDCSAVANSQFAIHYSTQLSLLILQRLRQFSGNGF